MLSHLGKLRIFCGLRTSERLGFPFLNLDPQHPKQNIRQLYEILLTRLAREGRPTSIFQVDARVGPALKFACTQDLPQGDTDQGAGPTSWGVGVRETVGLSNPPAKRQAPSHCQDWEGGGVRTKERSFGFIRYEHEQQPNTFCQSKSRVSSTCTRGDPFAFHKLIHTHWHGIRL